jgi:hypothetical protein
MSRIDFERDPLKHYVRRYGWLGAAKEQKHAIRKRSKRIPLRYFTFCAAAAIDVFMLEREGILERSAQTGRLESVYFCEQDINQFGIIADLIGSPENGFRNPFERIVLFKEDEETEGKTLEGELEEDQPYDPEVREKLRCKDEHYRLRNAFPFDIINLDVCGGPMFPPGQRVIAPLLRSIVQILEWQTESRFPINDRECNQFTLFLTSHVHPNRTNQEAVKQLENRVIENINTNVGFGSAFFNRYGHNQTNRLVHENFAEFFCLALPKFMIDRALYDYGWQVTCGPTYLYNRDDIWDANRPYQIMHTVSVYKRIPGFRERLDDRSPEQYTQSVSQLVNDGVEWVDSVMDPDTERKLQEDLKEIIEFRDQRRNS